MFFQYLLNNIYRRTQQSCNPCYILKIILNHIEHANLNLLIDLFPIIAKLYIKFDSMSIAFYVLIKKYFSEKLHKMPTHNRGLIMPEQECKKEKGRSVNMPPMAWNGLDVGGYV